MLVDIFITNAFQICRRHGYSRGFPVPNQTSQVKSDFLGVVPDRTISAQAPFEHACKHGYITVNIIVDANLGLVGVEAVESAGVLNKCSFPGYRQSQKQRVQSRIVKPFSNITPGCKNQPFFVIGDGCSRFKSSRRLFALLPPCRTIRLRVNLRNRSAKYSRCSLRSVSKIGERPSSSACRTSSNIRLLRCLSAVSRW